MPGKFFRLYLTVPAGAKRSGRILPSPPLLSSEMLWRHSILAVVRPPISRHLRTIVLACLFSTVRGLFATRRGFEAESSNSPPIPIVFRRSKEFFSLRLSSVPSSTILIIIEEGNFCRKIVECDHTINLNTINADTVDDSRYTPSFRSIDDASFSFQHYEYGYDQIRFYFWKFYSIASLPLRSTILHQEVERIRRIILSFASPVILFSLGKKARLST